MSTPTDDLEPKLVIEPLAALSVLDEIPIVSTTWMTSISTASNLSTIPI